MAIEEKVLETLTPLPPGEQREVRAFVESLKHHGRSAPLESLEGLWPDLDIKITEEDIAQMRREWSNSPRDIKL